MGHSVPSAYLVPAIFIINIIPTHYNTDDINNTVIIIKLVGSENKNLNLAYKLFAVRRHLQVGAVREY